MTDFIFEYLTENSDDDGYHTSEAEISIEFEDSDDEYNSDYVREKIRSIGFHDVLSYRRLKYGVPHFEPNKQYCCKIPAFYK